MTNESRLLHYWPLLVFVAYALSFAAFNFASSDGLIGFDVYYHARHANSFRTGEEMSLPVFSTLSQKQSSLYWLYHLSLAPFTAAFTGENFSALIVGTKIHNSLVLASLLTVFFCLARYLFEASGKASRRDAATAAFFSTALLLSLSPLFRIRLFDPRPHIVSMTLLLLIVYFLLRRQKVPLFMVSVLFPLLYSVSFIALIPALVFLISDALYRRPRRPHPETIALAIIPALGLVAGILLHPEPRYYLYNGYYVHLMALLRKYTEKLPEGAELAAFDIVTTEWFWVAIVIACVITQLWPALRAARPSRNLTFDRFFLLIMAAVLTPLAVMIGRAVEYAIPFVALLCSLVLFIEVTPALRRLELFAAGYRGPLQALVRLTAKGGAILRRPLGRPVLVALVLIVYAFSMLGLKAYRVTSHGVIPPTEAIQQAARVIEANSAPREIVFHLTFSDYPQLVFYNNRNRYIAGMGSIFTYTYDPNKYWLWHHVVQGHEKICAEADCDQSTHDIYGVIHDEFNAAFVFLDYRHNDTGFKENMDNDSRFTQLFRDGQHAEIVVYKVNES